MHHAAFMASTALGVSSRQPRPFKMGLQLFTLRAAMRQDVPGTLERIAGMGYEEVETYGFDDASIRYYGMDAKAFRALLAAHKLTTSSGHYDLNKFVTAPGGVVSGGGNTVSTATALVSEPDVLATTTV